MLTRAINTPSDQTSLSGLSSLSSLKVSASVTRADGRRIDTNILWSPDRATLDAALDLAIACAMADGSASITL